MARWIWKEEDKRDKKDRWTNRLNQGGHVLVKGAHGEGKEPPRVYGKHTQPSDDGSSSVAITGPFHVH